MDKIIYHQNGKGALVRGEMDGIDFGLISIAVDGPEQLPTDILISPQGFEADEDKLDSKDWAVLATVEYLLQQKRKEAA